MPELPEVEAYRRLAAERAMGRVISSVVAPDAWYLKGGITAPVLASVIEGRAIVGARRIGKLLLLSRLIGPRPPFVKRTDPLKNSPWTILSSTRMVDRRNGTEPNGQLPTKQLRFGWARGGNGKSPTLTRRGVRRRLRSIVRRTRRVPADRR